MSQIQTTSRQNCALLTVLCGKYAEKQRTPARLVPETKRVRLSYPFPELGSSGRLEFSWFLLFSVEMDLLCEFSRRGGLGIQVHTLVNHTVKQFREAQWAVQPNLLYLQGQQLENKEIVTFVWGDVEIKMALIGCFYYLSFPVAAL